MKNALLFLVSMMLVSLAPASSLADDNVESRDTWKPPPMPKATSFAELNLSQEQLDELEDKWGVRVLGIRLAASNYMLDFRFFVSDSAKALPLFDSRIKPYVLVDRSKAKLPVPVGAKIGSFRTTNRGKNIKAGRNYFIMFGNPDQHVKPGETITIIIGDFQIDHLVVS